MNETVGALGDMREPGRSGTEVIIRTLVTQLFAANCYGHFFSLTNTPPRTQKWLVFMFLCCPAMILYHIAEGIYRLHCYRLKSAKFAVNFWPTRFERLDLYMHVLLKANVDVKVEASPWPEQLAIDHADGIHSKSDHLSTKRVARAGICLFYMVQAIGSIILYFRRSTRVDYISALDQLNFQASFSAIVVAASSAYLSLSPGREADSVMTSAVYRHRKALMEWQQGAQLEVLFQVRILVRMASFEAFVWFGEARYLNIVRNMSNPVFFVLTVVIITKSPSFSIGVPVSSLRLLTLVSAVSAQALLVMICKDALHVGRHGGGWKDPWSDKLVVI